LAVAHPALACRCAQRDLQAYFDDAAVVFVGRAKSVVVDDTAPARRTVQFEIAGEPYKGDPASFTAMATPLSSATCGVAVDEGATYVVFRRARNYSSHLTRSTDSPVRCTVPITACPVD
jgi:hypothetical protein